MMQVITNEEAEKRGKIYDASGMTYLFDLDYYEPEASFTIDAATYGNASHFVNHSVSLNCLINWPNFYMYIFL